MIRWARMTIGRSRIFSWQGDRFRGPRGGGVRQVFYLGYACRYEAWLLLTGEIIYVDYLSVVEIASSIELSVARLFVRKGRWS